MRKSGKFGNPEIPIYFPIKLPMHRLGRLMLFERPINPMRWHYQTIGAFAEGAKVVPTIKGSGLIKGSGPRAWALGLGPCALLLRLYSLTWYRLRLPVG